MAEQRKQARQIKVFSEECRGCHLCQLTCSFYKTGVFKLSNSRISVKRDIDRIERYKVDLLDTCDGCGWCAKFCGYGAIRLNGDNIENG